MKFIVSSAALLKKLQVLSGVINATNTIPVLDVLNNYSHKVIGDRSFSTDSNIISAIGNHTIKLYNKRLRPWDIKDNYWGKELSIKFKGRLITTWSKIKYH